MWCLCFVFPVSCYFLLNAVIISGVRPDLCRCFEAVQKKLHPPVFGVALTLPVLAMESAPLLRHLSVYPSIFRLRRDDNNSLELYLFGDDRARWAGRVSTHLCFILSSIVRFFIFIVHFLRINPPSRLNGSSKKKETNFLFAEINVLATLNLF